MNILLTIVMCSSVANTCLEPFIFEKIYYDSYSCMVDGYKKSMEKMTDQLIDNSRKIDVLSSDVKELSDDVKSIKGE